MPSGARPLLKSGRPLSCGVTDDLPSINRAVATPAQAVAFEAGVLLLALALGWVFSVNPFAGMATTWEAVAIGVGATLPPVAGLWFMLRARHPVLLNFRRMVEDLVGPLFRGASWWHIGALAAMAGLAEEALFRGLLQVGLSGLIGWLPALIGASVVFGLVHWVTRLYAILAGIVGLYLGALYLATGNLLVPIVVHALYDMVALGYLRRVTR